MRPIDADALMEWAINIGCDGRWGISLDDLTDAIEDAPTVTTEPPKGEWEERFVECDNPFFRRRFYCSACGDWNTHGKSRYCPHCGAKMRRE